MDQGSTEPKEGDLSSGPTIKYVGPETYGC